MACLGVHFAVEQSVAQELIGAAGDDETLVELVQKELEEEWDEEHLFETDKAWDALHRCFSDGTLNVTEEASPLALCFFGGRILNEEPDYFVVLLEPAQVSQTAEALAGVTKEWLRDRYFSLEFPDYGTEKGEEDFEYSWENLEGLAAFYQQAAADRRWVVFTVDQ